MDSEVAQLQAYFSDKNEDKKRIYKFDILNTVLNFFYDLSDRAFSKIDHRRVLNPYKSLPISYEDVYRIVCEEKDSPPLTLITRIATRYFNQIYLLSEHLHKVLNRTRTKVQADRVQQIDIACLQWLTRQPGNTPEMKAKNSQRIMAVVREENYNTLENRVLKEFLIRCDLECIDYLRLYKASYFDNPVLQNVSRFKSLITKILSNPIFANVSRIEGIPKPNYVLQNNSLYNTVWKLYLELIMKNRQLVSIWNNRSNLFADIFYVLQIARINHFESKEKPIKHDLWINPVSFDSFFKYANWNYIDRSPVHSRMLYRDQKGIHSIIIKNGQTLSHNVKFSFLNNDFIPFTNTNNQFSNVYYVENAFNENRNNILTPKNGDVFLRDMMNIQCLGMEE